MSESSQFCKKCRALVIHNPVAGGRRRRRLARALRALRALDVDVEVQISLSAGDARTRARAAWSQSHPPDLVIAAGGDGTINEVANGLDGSEIAMAAFPLGTANVYAYELGLPSDPESWARMVADGHTETVYLGTAGERSFVAMVSVGFDSRAVAKVNPEIKRYLGGAAYALEGLQTLFTGGGDRFRVIVDGEEYESGWAIIAKSSHFAGPFRLVPTAHPTARYLGVTLFPVRGIGRIYDLLLVGWGRVDAVPGVRLLTAEHVRIESDPPVSVQMDGDRFGMTPVEISVGRPQKMVVPRNGSDGAAVAGKSRVK